MKKFEAESLKDEIKEIIADLKQGLGYYLLRILLPKWFDKLEKRIAEAIEKRIYG